MAKRCLNLDGMFIPIPAPEIEYKLFKFNGGELHIKLNNNIDYSKVDKVIITNRINSSDDVMKVLIAKEALERKGVKSFDLIMPYIPYARQDRQCEDGESFTLKVFTNLINSANFDNIIVLDAHSDVAPALLNNCTNISNEQYIDMAFHHIAEYYDADITLISPDSGANKKANKLYENLQVFNNLIKCDKRRNTKTGKLNGFEVFANDLNGKTCLITDDICDGGRTFIGIAEELKKKNAGKIYLFVTHGIFSNGFESLEKHFAGIFSTNSFSDIENDLLTQFKIQL